MDMEQTLPRDQRTQTRGGLFRRMAKIGLWAAALYVLLHLALVPAFSFLTNTKYEKKNTPKNWGLQYQSHEVKGPLGFKIPAWYVPGAPAKPVILVLTGSGGNKYGTIARHVTLMLHEKGYNVFLFDTRGQGLSGGIKTFGIGEAVDVVRVLDYLSHTYPRKKIGAVGFSLGAASILRAAGMDSRLRAVVAYASYAELDSDLIRNEVSLQLRTALKGQISRKHQKYAESGVKAARMLVCPALVKLSLKLWSLTFSSVPTPREAVSGLGERAVLLMHNEGDPEIPIKHLSALYEAAQTTRKNKMIFRFDTHEPSFWNATFRSRFKAALQGFLGKNL